MVTQFWVNIGTGNGLLSDSTKPLPEPILTPHNDLISEVLWHSLKRNFTVSSLAPVLHNKLENHAFKIAVTSLKG